MPEAEDRIEFTMVNGESFSVMAPAGQGRMTLSESYEGTWVTIDDETRIRTDKIVSIKLYPPEDAPTVL